MKRILLLAFIVYFIFQLNNSMSNPIISLIFLFCGIVFLIFYYFHNKSDLKWFIDFSKSVDFSFSIKEKWYDNFLIILPIYLFFLIVSYSRYENFTLKLIEFLYLFLIIIGFSFIDFFYRQKKGLYKVLISKNQICFIEETRKLISINEIKKIILTGNKKQLWIKYKNSNFVFNLNKINDAERREFLLALKSISSHNDIFINDNLLKFA